MILIFIFIQYLLSIDITLQNDENILFTYINLKRESIKTTLNCGYLVRFEVSDIIGDVIYSETSDTVKFEYTNYDRYKKYFYANILSFEDNNHCRIETLDQDIDKVSNTFDIIIFVIVSVTLIITLISICISVITITLLTTLIIRKSKKHTELNEPFINTK